MLALYAATEARRVEWAGRPVWDSRVVFKILPFMMSVAIERSVLGTSMKAFSEEAGLGLKKLSSTARSRSRRFEAAAKERRREFGDGDSFLILANAEGGEELRADADGGEEDSAMRMTSVATTDIETMAGLSQNGYGIYFWILIFWICLVSLDTLV